MTGHWDDWQFLIGEWMGEGDGEPGQASGGFTFSFDLQGRVLVRKNYADYPATPERPAFRHDDLMVIYQEAKNPVRAIYFDNEGHIIHYTVEFSNDQKALVFLGDIDPSAPRFRFTYNKLEEDKLGITFEIAPPGRPEEFAAYIRANARRK